MKILTVLALLNLWSLNILASSSPLSGLAIQDRGRVKPLDSFSRESMQILYGKRSFQGKDPTDFLFVCLVQPKLCQEQKFFQVRNIRLKQALQLSEQENYFSPGEISTNPHLPTVMAELSQIEESGEKGDPLAEAIQTLQSQLGLYNSLVTGVAWRLVPPKEGDAWIAYPDFSGPVKEQFHTLSKAFASYLAGDPVKERELMEAVDEFVKLARAENETLYPERDLLDRELHFNSLHPFMWAWVSYLVAILLLAFSASGKPVVIHRLAWLSGLCGLGLHTYGFALRTLITGRAPVSNMYETVIWVAWGAVFFSMIFGAVYKRVRILISGLSVSILCLILADLAPTILDSSLQPLMPVLRSNFWLTVHVLVITISYAAFFLALGLADWGLIYFLRGESRFQKEIKEVTQVIHRTLQVGVILLAAGIILGGVWADYSWGRFWGWDPKETWALIALLGYLALLHGRLAGWFREFGMMAGSIISFSLVIMAWYGVNYVLGAGLHSYGFGAGGIGYVMTFVGIHMVYVIFTYFVRQQKKLLTN